MMILSTNNLGVADIILNWPGENVPPGRPPGKQRRNTPDQGGASDLVACQARPTKLSPKIH